MSDPQSLAERKCAQRGRPFAELFRNQFVLDRDRNRAYPGFVTLELGAGWILHHGAALHVARLEDAAGQAAGAVLGLALTPDSRLIETALRLPGKADAPGFLESAEDSIAALAGKYVVVLVTEAASRVYGDPVLDMPILYDPETRRVASSLGLMLDRDIRPNPPFAARRVLAGRGSLSFGNTLDASARRLLSNHYLDLDSFAPHRHWPTEDTRLETAPAEFPGEMAAIIERLSNHLGALIDHFDCVLSVTGGRDSRMLLGCAFDRLGDLHELSGYHFHQQTRRDVAMARQIVSDIGHHYKVYRPEPPSRTALRDMRLKMGWSGSRGELQALAMLNSYPRDHVILRGNIMELLRANQWRQDKLDQPLHLVHGVRRLRLGVSDRGSARVWRSEYTKWFDGLPPAAQARPYDFGFVEMSLPNYQGAYLNGYGHATFLNPFNDRELIRRAIALPPRYRYEGHAVQAVIARAQPYLLSYPFI